MNNYQAPKSRNTSRRTRIFENSWETLRNDNSTSRIGKQYGVETSSLVVAVGNDNMVSILAVNAHDHSITFPKKKQVAVSQFLFPKEEEKLIETGAKLLTLNGTKNGEVLNQINQLLRVGKNRRVRQPKRPRHENHKIWFPTPETCQNPEDLPPLQTKFFDNVSDFQQRDPLNPQSNENFQETFLKQFDWTTSSLSAEQISQMQLF